MRSPAAWSATTATIPPSCMKSSRRKAGSDSSGVVMTFGVLDAHLRELADPLAHPAVAGHVRSAEEVDRVNGFVPADSESGLRLPRVGRHSLAPNAVDELVTFVNRLDARLDQPAQRNGGGGVEALDFEAGLVFALLKLRPARLGHKLDRDAMPLERDC